MTSNDPTGFKAYFPWIHPSDWTYPAPNHSQGVLDGLQTTINIVSYHTHTHVYFYRPAPPPPEYGIYYDRIPAKQWGDLKVHPADDIHIYGVKLLNDYFAVTEKEEPELVHFSLWFTTCSYSIDMDGWAVVIPSGLAVCLNPMKTSLGVPRGKAKRNGSELITYPKTWIHPKKKYIDWPRSIKSDQLIHLPEVAQLPHTVWTPPDLD